MEYIRKLSGGVCDRCGKRRPKGDCNLLLCRKCCPLICLTEPYGVEKEKGYEWHWIV